MVWSKPHECSSVLTLSGLGLWLPRLVGPHHIKRLDRAVLVRPRGHPHRDGIMTSLPRGLLCFVGFLLSGARGTSPQFRSQNLQIRPLHPRASPQVPPGLYQDFEDIRSVEQASDEAQSAESFQEALLFHQQQQQQQQGQHGTRPGDSSHLMQESGRRHSRGWYPARSYTHLH